MVDSFAVIGARDVSGCLLSVGMRLVLIRHADAYAGFDGLIGGPHGCMGLTELGRHQANLLRTYLVDTGGVHADVLLSSILPRALETAEIIAPALDVDTIHQDCELCEIHTGDADAMAWTEYDSTYGWFDMESEPERVFAPGGDSWKSFHVRVDRILARLATEYSDRTVVAVSHAGVIMASLRVLFDIPHPGTGTRLRPTNTGITEWEYEQAFDRWTLHSFNEHAHLRDFDAHRAQSRGENATKTYG
jgi:broad specificity phosphatase PhoE